MPHQGDNPRARTSSAAGRRTFRTASTAARRSSARSPLPSLSPPSPQHPRRVRRCSTKARCWFTIQTTPQIARRNRIGSAFIAELDRRASAWRRAAASAAGPAVKFYGKHAEACTTVNWMSRSNVSSVPRRVYADMFELLEIADIDQIELIRAIASIMLSGVRAQIVLN